MAALEIRERFVASTLVARELLRNAGLCTPPKPLSTLQIVELTYPRPRVVIRESRDASGV